MIHRKDSLRRPANLTQALHVYYSLLSACTARESMHAAELRNHLQHRRLLTSSKCLVTSHVHTASLVYFQGKQRRRRLCFFARLLLCVKPVWFIDARQWFVSCSSAWLPTYVSLSLRRSAASFTCVSAFNILIAYPHKLQSVYQSTSRYRPCFMYCAKD